MQQAHPVRSSGIPAPLKSNLTLAGEKKVYPRDSVRLFKSDFWEKFTHVHPVIPLLVWVPVIAILIYRSFAVHAVPALEFAAVFAAGLFIWSLIEYVLHRFVFHYPAKSAFGNRMVYILHGLHHEDPQDPTRLVMPPLPALIYSTILFIAFRAVFGPVLVEPFFASFLVGYLAYDYVHYYVHHFTPKYAVGKYLKRYHMIHHFSHYDAKWGVSNPLWDYVFRTVEARPSLDGKASPKNKA
jgi:sterol desaturase/sphingolipid hydroxylase (fatty acid hydroxylase superfamily)